MSNLKRRLMKLESRAGGTVAVIVVEPWETEEQAREKHFAQYPEHRLARNKVLVYLRDVTGRQVERD